MQKIGVKSKTRERAVVTSNISDNMKGGSLFDEKKKKSKSQARGHKGNNQPGKMERTR